MAPQPALNGRYRILEPLGRGSSASVFLVEDLHGSERRALKLVRDLGPASSATLLTEFRRLARLEHPCLVKVHDIDRVATPLARIPAGTLFFTADFVEGRDPIRALASLPVDARLAASLTVLEDVAAALAHVHAAGWVHCDVKTANIMVTANPTRAVLFDLGLSALRGGANQARGSLAYMAPEALAATPEPRSDLFSLGVTLYEMVAGFRPYRGDDTSALIASISDGEAPPLQVDWCDWRLAELIARLIDPDPQARPSSAAVVLDEAARVREALDLPAARKSWRAPKSNRLLPPPIVGRDAALAELGDVLVAIAGRDAVAPRFVELVGAPGSGRWSVARHAARRHQLAAAGGRLQPVSLLAGDAGAIGTALDVGPSPSATRWCDEALRIIARRSEATPQVVLVADTTDERAAALARAAQAGHPLLRERDAVIVVCTSEPIGDGGEGWSRSISIEPLTPEQGCLLVDAMVGRSVERAWSRELVGTCSGLPRFIVEAVRAAAATHGPDRIEERSPSSLVSGSSREQLDRLVVQRIAALPAPAVQLVEAVAVAGGQATVEGAAAIGDLPLDEIVDRAGELVAMGVLSRAGEALALPSPADAEAIDEAIPAARRKALHRAALEWIGESAPAVERVRHLRVTGPARATADACAAAADELRASGRAQAAVQMSRLAAAKSSGRAAARAQLQLARDAAAVGAYAESIAAAQRASRSRSDETRIPALLALARAQQKSGDYESAERALQKLIDSGDGGEEAVGAFGRLLVSRGRYADAASVCGAPENEAPTSGPVDRGRALRLEAAILARMYEGDYPAARRAAERLENAARAGGDSTLLARALSMRGMLAQADGDVARAAELYAAAGTEARAAGDIHAAAVYELNRATVYMDRGRHGRALEALDAARISLRRLGDVAELAAVLFNRGTALLALGELDAARRAAERASACAAEHGAAQMQIYARLLQGDVDRRNGDLVSAEARYREAVELASAEGSARELMLARTSLAELRAASGGRDALKLLEGAAEAASSDDDRDRWLLSKVRIHLALGVELGDLDGRLGEAIERIARAGRDDLVWRARLLAARVAQANGDPGRAATSCAAARATLDELLRDTPEAHRAGARTDPDARALAALEAELDGARATARPSAPQSSADLRRLLGLSRRLNSELRLAPLLDQVIDTVIDMTSAERGFLLLFEPASTHLEVVVARNFDQSALGAGEVEVSRSIAERAAHTGDVVLAVDAAFDDRFDEAASVAALRLRSVLAVPLRQKGRIIGTIYVDHRFRRGAFDDEAVELVRELADIAAVAIENARLVEENQARQREIAALNERLQAEVIEKESQLESVRAQLPRSREGLRHGYEAIVGRSPAMLDMLRAIDRASDTDFPVVVLGESGTGKELVARALHENGRRADAAFVAINCGAVPEQLLESELFGHVRGAFTGANRDRRGLFEVAHQGTLFLDEVADTSLAMQAKLLRVLQEGEVRRVGDERTRRVDVRIIAASNRPLRQMVETGSFREDLFYRLSVLEIGVPPLRDRVEDMAELAAHILTRLCDGADPPAVTRAAMARLCAYHWPGNVRELENELARASALGDTAIDVADLSARIAEARARRPTAEPDDLRIKPQVEALERALVDAALDRTRGNQTAAAKLLGLSRYGLQKKLKRYGIAGSGA